MGYITDIRRSVGHAPLFMPGAGVFFIDAEGRALLQRRRDNGLWAGTGGAMEFGETFEDTVRREAFEEVGLLAQTLERLNVYSGEEMHHVYPNLDEVYVVSVMFICEKYSGVLAIDPEECLEARFFALAEFPEDSDVHPTDRPMVHDLASWMKNRETTRLPMSGQTGEISGMPVSPAGKGIST
jgi:8-oxo-dGTP pyrophosphatase MutT (NUDIX family)